MTSSSFSIFTYFIIILSVVLLIAGCSGSQAVVNETWTVVRLLDTGEEIQSTSKTLEVRHCTSKEVKEVSCSAGTSRNFSISLAGVGQLSGGLSAGAEVEGNVGIEAGVGAELGFDRHSGQTLNLDSPQKGFIRQYELTEKYTIISGKAVAQSSNGTEKEGNYIFQSSCDFTIVSEQDLSCDGQSVSQPTNEPTSANKPTPADTPSSSFNLTAIRKCEEFGGSPASLDSITSEQIERWRQIGKTDRGETARVIYCEIHQSPNFRGFVEGDEIPAGVIITADLGFYWNSMYPESLERLVHDGGGWGVFLSLKPFVVQHADDLPNDVGGQYWFVAQ